MTPVQKATPVMATQVEPLQWSVDSPTRWNITPAQRRLLERTYRTHPYPVLSLREQLGRELNVTPRQVQIWFQNRRQRTRKGGPDDGEDDEDDGPVVANTGEDGAPVLLTSAASLLASTGGMVDPVTDAGAACAAPTLGLPNPVGANASNVITAVPACGSSGVINNPPLVNAVFGASSSLGAPGMALPLPGTAGGATGATSSVARVLPGTAPSANGAMAEGVPIRSVLASPAVNKGDDEGEGALEGTGAEAASAAAALAAAEAAAAADGGAPTAFGGSSLVLSATNLGGADVSGIGVTSASITSLAADMLHASHMS